jgi:hypothetical protein
MSRASKLQLPFAEWPEDDRARWETAFKPGDLFDDDRRGTHLSQATRTALQVSYARYLRFISDHHQNLLAHAPDHRINRELLAEYVKILKKTNRHSSICTLLHHLRLALKLICPQVDWSWFLTITKRIAASAPHKAKKFGLVSIDQLHLLGIELMDAAVVDSQEKGEVSKEIAMKYRDGLMIALLSAFVPRRRTIAAMRIGKQLIRAGNLWAIDIPAEDTKNKRAFDPPISPALSERIDVYVERFRNRLPGAEAHDALWPSNQRRAMSASAIYDAVRRRTKSKFGFGVNLHRFRHASGSLWSVWDPVNVRG